MLKSYFLVMIAIVFASITAHAQSGLYAGSFKKWVKKEIETQHIEKVFKGFTLGMSMTVLEDAEIDYYIYVYQKETTYIVLLLTQIKDALSCTIQDVIEIKNVRSNDNIQTGSCSSKGKYDAKIVVLEKNFNGKQVNTKAWMANLDKVHFTSISTKGINCIVEGAD
jgi:hypothetical protein